MIDIPIIVDIKGGTITNGDHTVLDNVHFQLADGEMVYIIGKSGSGKSSLIKTLYGDQELGGGHCIVAGEELGTLSRKSLPLFRRKLGIVFQEFHLLTHWTVGRNLEYVLKATEWKDKNEIVDRVQTVLGQIGMADKINEVVDKLSGGEQQKVAIARAILNSPSLLLADEPTGNLDPESSDEVMYLLHEVANKNKTAIVVATHDYRLLEKFPARVYKCEGGQLLETNSATIR